MADFGLSSELFDTVRGFSPDIFAVAGLFTLLFIFFFRNGIRSAVALLLATDIAALAYAFFPYYEEAASLTGQADNAAILRVSLFSVFLILAYAVVRRPIAADTIWFGAKRWFQSLFFAALQTGLLLALAYHVIPVRELIALNATFDPFFLGEAALFGWFVAPLLVIFALMRRTL